MSVKRTIIIEPGVDAESGNVVLRFNEACDRVERLMGTLAEIGGVIRIVADRVKIGELPGEKRPDVLGETVGFIIEYDSVAPLHEESLSAMMLDVATGDGPRVAARPRAAAPAEPLEEPQNTPDPEVPAASSLAAAVGAETAPEPRFMAGPGGEEEEVPHELWEERLAAGWTFDDEDDDNDEVQEG